MARRRGKKKRRGGPSGYPEEVKQQAMSLWAMGKMKDAQIAAAVGVKRTNTICEWRNRGIPQDWEEFRRRAVAQASEKAEKKVADTITEVTARQLKQTRTAMDRLLKDLRDGKAATGAQTASALTKLQEEERQLMGQPGRTDEVILSDLSEDNLRERLRQRLGAIRQADAADTGRAGGEGMAEAEEE